MRQEEALQWAHDTFGRIALDRGERTLRLLEEAMEAAHAEGSITIPEVLRMMARVWEGPRGDYRKELAQVGMCCEAAAANVGLGLSRAIDEEFARLKAAPKEERVARHNAKVAAGFARGFGK